MENNLNFCGSDHIFDVVNDIATNLLIHRTECGGFFFFLIEHSGVTVVCIPLLHTLNEKSYGCEINAHI